MSDIKGKQAGEEALKMVKEQKQVTALKPLTKPIKPKKHVQSVEAYEAERQRERLRVEKARKIEQQKKLHEQEMEALMKRAYEKRKQQQQTDIKQELIALERALQQLSQALRR